MKIHIRRKLLERLVRLRDMLEIVGACVQSKTQPNRWYDDKTGFPCPAPGKQQQQQQSAGGLRQPGKAYKSQKFLAKRQPGKPLRTARDILAHVKAAIPKMFKDLRATDSFKVRAKRENGRLKLQILRKRGQDDGRAYTGQFNVRARKVAADKPAPEIYGFAADKKPEESRASGKQGDSKWLEFGPERFRTEDEAKAEREEFERGQREIEAKQAEQHEEGNRLIGFLGGNAGAEEKKQAVKDFVGLLAKMGQKQREALRDAHGFAGSATAVNLVRQSTSQVGKVAQLRREAKKAGIDWAEVEGVASVSADGAAGKAKSHNAIVDAWARQFKKKTGRDWYKSAERRDEDTEWQKLEQFGFDTFFGEQHDSNLDLFGTGAIRDYPADHPQRAEIEADAASKILEIIRAGKVKPMTRPQALEAALNDIREARDNAAFLPATQPQGGGDADESQANPFWEPPATDEVPF